MRTCQPAREQCYGASHVARTRVRTSHRAPCTSHVLTAWLPSLAAAYLLLYVAAGWALTDYPVAQSIFASVGQILPPVLVSVVVVRRRREWAGCQRLFWNTFGIGSTLWIIGHLGWTYSDIVRGSVGWLQWHTLFSLCGGIFPLISLLARPHRGVRPESVASIGLDVASYGMLAVFLYSYFVLVPSGVWPEADARGRLLVVVQIQGAALVAAGFVGAAYAARKTDWFRTYAVIAFGVVGGFCLRFVSSWAMARGSYQVGTFHDLAWVLPFVCYACAVLDAPASVLSRDRIEPSLPVPSTVWAGIPVFLVPVIGYGAMTVQSLGQTGDSFRALLTGLLTVAGLGLLTLRLAAQSSELQRTDARLRLLAEATERTQDLILITRADGVVEHANEAFVRALGYSRVELARCSFADLVDSGAQSIAREILRDARTKGVWRGTLIRRRRDGSTFPAACTVTALQDGGAMTHFVGVERDVTDQRRLQDQLVHTERLSAIGELVAGIAHEVSNPLQTVLGSVELMLEEEHSAQTRKDLETVRRESGRAAQIVRNLLAFVRRSSPDRQSLDLNDIVRDALALRLFQLQQRSIGLVTELAPPLPVLGSREELQQVVLNLVNNAEHAIAGGRETGTITVRTRSEGHDHIVEVIDDGPGVSDELRGRIFEPFFTTKTIGEGTGLGLSISHGIALAHGGRLELIASTVGATFRLSLPAYVTAPAPLVAPAGWAPSGTPAKGSRSALIIDDQEPIRRLVARLLEKRGYEVIEAENGETGLAIAASREVFLVLCDVRMPGISGTELYARLSSEHPLPDRRFIFITGDRSLVKPEMAALDGVSILSKPFTAAELDEALSAGRS